MLNSIISHLELFSMYYPYLIILSTVFISYAYVIFKGGFVSDDLQGIQQYDGTLMYPVEDKDGKTTNDAKGQVIKARKIMYGTLSKWVRNKLCGGNFPSRHRYPKKPDGKEGDFIESAKVPSHHHFLSVALHAIACVLLYRFLLTVTTPTIALMTVILFSVHPTCVQAVAWPSAIGYILSLICICSVLNISTWASGSSDLTHIIIGLAGITFFQVWGVYAQGIPLTTGLIMIFLGQWQFGLVALLVAGVASYFNLGGYVSLRKTEFKKQHMADSIYLTARKPIVVLKTLAYYIYLAILPIRMGLYHEWGFHYDKKMELLDWRAICGLFVLVLSCFFFYVGTIEVRLGILWFYAFIGLFLNFITAQQWVTERYLYIPVIGLCLIACLFLQNFLILYFFILGMLLCRTLVHLPTYDNELRFYLSNTWNFPKSEVAYGNLGVAYTSLGLVGASSDMWIVASTINPEYDVPYYNLYSKHKSSAFLAIQNGSYEQGLQGISQCIPMLEKVLSRKILHFPEGWKKELDELKQVAANPIGFLLNEMNRLENLKTALTMELLNTKDKKRQDELTPSIQDNQRQMESLKNFLKSKGVILELNPEKALLSKLTNPGGMYGK